MSETAARIDEPILAININQTYRHGISADELYECTRGIWRLNRERATKARYAFAVYQGIIREVYDMDHWYPAGSTKYHWRQFNPRQLKKRYEFVGKVASDEVRDRYIGRRMPNPHTQNPIRYYNC
jgi:uncharacterized protein